MVLRPFVSITAGTWIVSPHPDDAALSLALAIVGGELPRPINVVSVFTVSEFSSHPDSDRDTVTALRAIEDSAFASWSDVVLHTLDFLDAPLRAGFGNSRSVFDSNNVVSDSLRAQVASRVFALNDRWSTSLLVLPSGIGHHIDHRTVAEIGRYIPAGQTAYYSDQPYASAVPGELDWQGSLIWTAKASPRNVVTKKHAISYYGSQPAVTKYGRYLNEATERTGIEFLWSR